MRRRIAFVLASCVLGGHEVQSAELVRLAQSVGDVTVFLNAEAFRPLFDGMNVTLVVRPGLFFEPGHVLKQFMRGIACRNEVLAALEGFDQVIVCAGAVEAGVLVGVAGFGRLPLDLYLPFFYDRRVIWARFGSLYNAVLRVLLNLYGRVITINRVQARLIKQGYRGQVVVAGNQVPAMAPLRAEGVPARLVFIGRLDAQKRVLQLIEAMDFPQNPFRELLVIGDGPLRHEVEVLATQVAFTVRCLGWLTREQQHDVLTQSDVLILNSAIEGEPLVIREAALRGMLAVVPDIPGVRGVTVRALRFGDVASLQSLLVKMADPAWLASCRQTLQFARSRKNRARSVEVLFPGIGQQKS
jgi:glycosyltransferase involved in cell wall biosynthesis